ncbi:MAG: CoA transferase subunit B [Elusimicrobia bacterium]|nr:CoA transferase subunit B [Elusimicrobiota bacterium]
MEKREFIARRAAKELKDGNFVNLGIGLPTLVPNYLSSGVQVILHTENGMLGYGPYPIEGEEDPDLINAGKETITELPGCSYFSSADSFGMVRGGHLDLTFLGAFEVSQKGDLANWMIPGKKVKGMGGAMDIVAGTKKVIVLMEHSNNGKAKILKECRLPLTGKEVVDMIITERGVFEVTPQGLLLKEIASDTTLEEIKKETEASFQVANPLPKISF